jgi:hypothetical protein
MPISRVLAALAGAVILAGVGPARADTCRALEMRLMQLQASGRQTAPIHNLLIDRGCRSGRRVAAAPPQKRYARLQRTVRVRAPLERGNRPARPSPGGTYRTLCVRTCDGYYFPISFSTTREHFSADEAACRQMCPGDAALYYHSQSGEGPADMLSLEGAPYASLPTAFRHLSTLDKSCTCGTSSPISVAAVRVVSEPEAEERALLPKPRPEPGEDPETMANRGGGLAPAALANAVAMDRRSPGSVRIVGAVDRPAVLLLTSVPN